MAIQQPTMLQLPASAPLSQRIASQMGGMLGQLPAIISQQRQQQQQQKELQTVLASTEDVAERYARVSDYYMQRGDAETAQKFATLSMRQQEHELAVDKMYEGRDTGLRKYALGLAKLELDSKRIAGLTKYYDSMSKSQGKSVAEKQLTLTTELVTAAADTTNPEKAQAAQMLLNKLDEQGKSRYNVPTKNEVDSVRNILRGTKVGNITIGDLDKKDVAATFDLMAQTIANDAKAWARANPTSRDWGEAVNQAIEANRGFMGATSPFWGKDTLTFDKSKQIQSFGSIEDAEAAKLPKGTEVLINGRRAIID